ncbi:Y-family DNA polymerase [Sansalvadorimonas sp. 2012CJ34-2]|uniref:Y-family DNA polymerase n=1 Tax=Parendozoicomonas callyspongiae TaxID=2942213 RepID=A0ABT0PBQ1_9GAMM|nr:Y-family DNA polymerase [Sansalvadorimonas sp. 2012CJ34-2]MCL6268819.1 Y-family DNA polymerase [Sansalvadorimonas sp. 2012CJ34-2]
MSQTPPAIIAHCDANCFYCSCHRVFEPELRGQPLGVLSNNDGCIIARTPELKAMNIAMATPFFKVKGLFNSRKIYIRSSNYPLYGDMSDRFMTVLGSFTPDVEVYSIDEAFLRFDGFSIADWAEHGKLIQQRVGQWTGLPIGVGLSTTKVLAKLANYAAKRYPATGGVVDLTSVARQKKLMEITPVGEVWGIGRRLRLRLEEKGIRCALDLANQEPSRIRKQFSIAEERLVKELRGESCLPWEEGSVGNKHTIMCSRSFGEPVRSKKEVQAAVATYASRACEKMRLQNKKASQAMLFIRTNPFEEKSEQYYGNLILSLPQASDSTQAWLKKVREGVNRIFREGYAYRKAGFVFLNISDCSINQGDLFESGQSSTGSMKVMDQINQRFGREVLKPAVSGFTPARWHMKQQHLCSRYTTCWNEIPVVQCR